MLRPTALLLLLLPLCVVTAGCDPYQRPGNWRPNSSNAANLRAMAAVPADLVVAEPEAPATGALAVEALNRLRYDRVRSLPDSGLADIVLVKDASSGSAAAAPQATGGN